MERKKSKFLIGIPIYKRPHIVEIQLDYTLNTLIPHIKTKGLDVELLVVGSDEIDTNLVSNFKTIKYFCIPNILSDKFNFLMNYAKDHSFDYLMALGSDDLMPIALFDSVFELVEENGYIASPCQMWMCDTNTSYIYKWMGYTNAQDILKKYGLGAGRIYSKKTIDCLSRQPFGKNKMNSMESNISQELDAFVSSDLELTSFVDANDFLFCLKSDENIWKIFDYSNLSSNIFTLSKKYFDWIPHDTKQKIIKLVKK